MTHDPVDSNHASGDIPELFDRLESRVASPDPQAIRAEATRRGAARKRLVGAAGAFVLLAAIAVSALALTRDSASTTETAASDDDNGSRLGGLFTQSPDASAIADDSAAFDISGDIRSAGLQVLAIEGEPIGDVITNVGNAPTRLQFRTAGTHEYQTDALEVFGPCRADAYEIEWDLDAIDTFHIAGTTQLKAIVRAVGSSTCESPSADYLFAPEQTMAVSVSREIPGRLTIRSSGDPSWDLTASQPEVAPVVAVSMAECLNDSTVSIDGSRWFAANLPSEWTGYDLVYVTVLIDGDTLVATDADGLTASFGRDNGEPRPTDCLTSNQATVPDVQMLLADSARQMLGAEGFNTLINFEIVEDPELVNRVIRQDPAPGTLADLGSTVTATVGIEQQNE